MQIFMNYSLIVVLNFHCKHVVRLTTIAKVTMLRANLWLKVAKHTLIIKKIHTLLKTITKIHKHIYREKGEK
jgi:hypothetical protein